MSQFLLLRQGEEMVLETQKGVASQEITKNDQGKLLPLGNHPGQSHHSKKDANSGL